MANNINIVPFYAGGPTVNLDAGTTSANVQVQTGRYSHNIRIWNSGTVPVFIEVGDDSLTADPASSMPIPPGNTEILSCPFEYVTAVTASGTATIYITPGEGV